MNIDGLSGIRNHDPNYQAVADLHLRQHYLFIVLFRVLSDEQQYWFCFLWYCSVVLCRYCYYYYTVTVNYYYNFYPCYWSLHTCILMLILQLASGCEVST